MKLDVYNIEGSKTGRSVDLPDDIFAIEPNDHAVYLAVKQYRAAQRQGTHSSKERNAVKGSSKKIKRQKGTGTARAGDIKNPVFRGGGRMFGPRPDRNYSIKLNKKVKRLARKSALTSKAKAGTLIVLEDFSFDAPKTKAFTGILDKLELAGKKTLVVTTEYDANIYLSCRNVQGSNVMRAQDLSTYDILNNNTLILSEGSINKIKASFGN